MKVLCRQVARELHAQRFVFAGAAALGFLPLVWAAHLPEEAAGPLRLGLVQVLVVLTLAGLPLWRGATWLDRDCRHFRLPAADALATLLTAFGCAWLVGLPAALADPELAQGVRFYLLGGLFGAPPDGVFEPFGWRLPIRLGAAQWRLWQLAGPLSLMAALLAAGRVLSFLAARRGRLALADLACWSVFVAVTFWAFQRFLERALLGVFLGWLPLLFLGLAAVGAAGAVSAFAAGRDLARAHRRHSSIANPGLLVLALLVVIGTRAATRAELAELSSYSYAAANADGSLWLIGGPQEGSDLAPLFLFEPATGRSRFAAALANLTDSPELGERYARLAVRSPRFLLPDLAYLAPDRPTAVRPHYLLEDPHWPSFTEVDASGTLRVRMDMAFTVTVYEVRTHRERASFVLPASDDSSPVSLRHQQGTVFDVVEGLILDDLVSRRYRVLHFDAATGATTAGEVWRTTWDSRFASYTWWREALPMMAAGFPLDVLAPPAYFTGLPASGVVLASTDDQARHLFPGRFAIVDRRGRCTGWLALPQGAYLAGEIRPGLLLAGIAPAGGPDPLAPLLSLGEMPREKETFARWTALAIDGATGRVLRSFAGFAPSHPRSGTARPFLLGPYGEPYDLESAAGEPRRILPFRPWHAAADRMEG